MIKSSTHNSSESVVTQKLCLSELTKPGNEEAAAGDGGSGAAEDETRPTRDARVAGDGGGGAGETTRSASGQGGVG